MGNFLVGEQEGSPCATCGVVVIIYVVCLYDVIQECKEQQL